MSYSSTTVTSGTVITTAWGNAMRDSAVHEFASSAARASAITAPAEGKTLTYLTDADQVDFYTGSKYVALGPSLCDALNITTASPFLTGLGAGSATTEMSSKLRLTAARVYSGQMYLITLTMLVQGSGLGSDWTVLCREDTASGTIVGAQYGIPNIGTNAQQTYLSYLWSCGSNASNKVFTFTYLRNAGAQTFSVYNTFAGGPSLNAGVYRLGDNSLYRTVP